MIVRNFISFSYNGRQVVRYHTGDSVRQSFFEDDDSNQARSPRGWGNTSWIFAIENVTASPDM